MESKITFLKGEVTLEIDGDAARPAVLGEIVPEGAVVRTGAFSEADIGYVGGGGMKLDAVTEVGLDHLYHKRETKEIEISVRKGRLFNKVRKLEGKSRYILKAPSGQIVVRGTEFFIEVADKAGLAATREGTVEVSGGTPASVGAGQMVPVAAGTPGAVVPVGERERKLFAQLDRIHELDKDGNIAKLAGITNSLGMDLVPLAIAGGATNGEVVMFAAHETRARDFAAFMADTGREYAMAGEDADAWRSHVYRGQPVGRGADETVEESDHPVVMVSWADANAFCAWLSKKEGRTYRLPTDHEWSFAVGIGDREDAAKTPQEKNLGIKDAYPWGGKFTPGEITGNYSDATARAAFGATWDAIPDYDDGFATTAPVMSFAPNKEGLYDLGGNVWEWCDSLYGNRQFRTLRGGSWFVFHDEGTLSSYRIFGGPQFRFNYVGFRVAEVIDPT